MSRDARECRSCCRLWRGRRRGGLDGGFWRGGGAWWGGFGFGLTLLDCWLIEGMGVGSKYSGLCSDLVASSWLLG